MKVSTQQLQDLRTYCGMGARIGFEHVLTKIYSSEPL
jgi:hypothetical protein